MPLLPSSARLLFREMSLEDLDFVADMLGDTEVMRYYPRTLSRQEAEEWIERQLRRYREHGHSLWLVCERTSGSPIGQVGLIPQLVDGVVEPEIGYLLHRPFWHQGYATEAAAAVRDNALLERGLDHVISLIRPENGPSRAVAGRIGLSPDREIDWKGFRHIVFRLDRRASTAG